MALAGDIVLFPFPLTNLSIGKLRPALLVKHLPSYNQDWLVCMISTQIPQQIPTVDEVIDTSDGDFTQSGLLQTSIIRVTRIAVVEQRIFLGKLWLNFCSAIGASENQFRGLDSAIKLVSSTKD